MTSLKQVLFFKKFKFFASIEHDRVDHSTAAEICSKEHKRSSLLTVGSLRKFLHVDVDYLAQVIFLQTIEFQF